MSQVCAKGKLTDNIRKSSESDTMVIDIGTSHHIIASTAGMHDFRTCNDVVQDYFRRGINDCKGTVN